MSDSRDSERKSADSMLILMLAIDKAGAHNVVTEKVRDYISEEGIPDGEQAMLDLLDRAVKDTGNSERVAEFSG